MYRPNAPYTPLKKAKGTEQGHALDISSTDLQTIFIAEEEEEEDDRILFGKNLEESSVFSYIHLPDYFIRHIEDDVSFSRDISCFTFFKSPYLVFHAFRL
jgi:hypothetical protein